MSFCSLNEWLKLDKIKNKFYEIILEYLKKIRIFLPDNLTLNCILFKNSNLNDRKTIWVNENDLSNRLSKQIVNPNLNSYSYYSSKIININEPIIIKHNLNKDNFIFYSYLKIKDLNNNKKFIWTTLNPDELLLEVIDNNTFQYTLLTQPGYVRILVLYY